MTKKSNLYHKFSRALALALLISLGVGLWGAPGQPIMAHPAYQEEGPASETTPDPGPTATPTPVPPEASPVVPVEAIESPLPEPSPTPLPAETPTPAPPEPAAQPLVQIAPVDLRLALGNSGTTEIQIESAAGLYGFDLRLTFNPRTITVIDSDPTRTGVQVSLGNLFQGQDSFLIRNRVNNTTGLIEVAVTLREPALPINGSGSIITINWEALAPGGTTLSPEISLSDASGGAIAHQVAGGQVMVTGETGEPITGRILLQGRTGHQGTQVFLSPESCATSLQGPGPGVLVTETNSDGSFEFIPPAGVTYQCLEAVKAGYLSGQKSNPQGNTGTATLLGGDVTTDGIIDVFDLAFLGSHYGDADTTADINGDGSVSIFDLTITAANYLREGPITLN